jgi:hypothetical protein
MQSPFSFIVEPLKGKRYDNTRTHGDVELIVSTSQEDHKFSNRYAVVKNLPLNYCGPIQINDTLLVHHNVFKFYNDMYGNRKSGKSFFKDDLFLVDPDQFYMYKNKKGWVGHDKYCFIKPLESKDNYLKKNSKYEPLTGTVKYINQDLLKKGVKVGDVVLYQPDSEYEFLVDDELLYRMFTDNITVVL